MFPEWSRKNRPHCWRLPAVHFWRLWCARFGAGGPGCRRALARERRWSPFCWGPCWVDLPGVSTACLTRQRRQRNKWKCWADSRYLALWQVASWPWHWLCWLGSGNQSCSAGGRRGGSLVFHFTGAVWLVVGPWHSGVTWATPASPSCFGYNKRWFMFRHWPQRSNSASQCKLPLGPINRTSGG